jgi:hypothetical protein
MDFRFGLKQTYILEIDIELSVHTSSMSCPHCQNIATMHFLRLKAILLIFCTFFGYNPAAYGVCQTSCAVVVAACYIANDAKFCTVRAIGAPLALLSCNTAFGTCQATCSTVWRARANGFIVSDQLMQRMGG